jgi:hypothetical protein
MPQFLGYVMLSKPYAPLELQTAVDKKLLILFKMASKEIRKLFPEEFQLYFKLKFKVIVRDV